MMRGHIFPGPAGCDECFFTGTSPRKTDFQQELESLLDEYASFLRNAGCSPESEILLRFHVSDPVNQFSFIRTELKNRRGGFLSVVGQMPAGGSRIALEAWHWRGLSASAKKTDGNTLAIQMQGGCALWHALEKVTPGSSFDHTMQEFLALDGTLARYQGSIARHTVRTWLYCKDVDNQYSGLVRARNEYFSRIGLVKERRFIASTGIEGKMADPCRFVKMDSLSITGLKEEDHVPVQADEYLSPTHIYGVAFERGMKILLRDRTWCFISGTASIDKNGIILHVGNVRRQTERMLENIAALLDNAEMGLDTLRTGTVYLRDPADAPVVEDILKSLLPGHLPRNMVTAPVCRPGWLVEMECFAATGGNHPGGVLPA